ncbi:PepSY domain-containing protein [Actinoplanes sp. LDG1-06]|uniref:PepSY domain-containing protein n=1 Tax=Paractinoplanes ovalisporus TaxID=2810368 RepID=A0ABS2AIE7_9ACTN|nr:PepSY domain-containing protein [Actinoplanes ovalisporus]MBM2619563.1 PepSY domain-containing protein [Actinoplanes ovalisporus]
MSLERRYRRLMLAYPGPYRTGHGADMVTTLLEMAEPGQTRPSRADAWHLVLSGLRQRFRLPSGRPLVLLAAVLITLIGGAFGAAAGSWAAEQTFTRLPGDSGVEALTRQVSGGGSEFTVSRSASPWWTGMASGHIDSPGWTPEAAQQRLTAAGWQVTAIERRDGTSFTMDPATGTGVEEKMRGAAFTAARDGLRLDVSGYVSAERGSISVVTWPADTGATRPLLVAGAVIGLLVGWLLAAAGAYRLGRQSVARRRLGVALTGLAVVASALPAFAFGVNVWRVFRYSDSMVFTVHSALNRGPYWSYGTPWMLLQLAVAAVVLAVVAWACVSVRPKAVSAADTSRAGSPAPAGD